MNLGATQETAWLWLRARLAAANVTGGRVYRETAPADAAFPLTLVTLIPYGSELGNGATHMYDQFVARVQTVSKDAPASSTQADRAAAYTALHDHSGAVVSTSGAVLSCVKSNDLPARPQRDGMTLYWYPGLEFQLTVQ